MVLVEEPLVESFGVGNSLALVLVSVVGILSVFHFWFQSLRSTKLGNKLPGLPPLPIIGSAYLALNKNPQEIMQMMIELTDQIGPIVRVWFGTKLMVLVKDTRDVELILGNHLEKSAEYDFFQPWLGDGLLISKGEKWRFHRKMIAPTFHQSILKTFIPVFNKNANDLVGALKEISNKEFDIHDYLSGTTVDVLLETVMGVKKTKEAKSSFEYAKAVMDMCNILHVRHYSLWLRSNFIFRFTKMFGKQETYLKIIHSLTDTVIGKKKTEYFDRQKSGHVSLYNVAVRETEQEETMKNVPQTGISFGSALRDDLDDLDDSTGEKKRLAFLDFMIEASQTHGNNTQKFNDLDIREEVNTIMFEGHDTTAAASSFFICLLGVHQDIQEKVYQEVKDILQDSDRPITFNDTLEMKYLERTLLETLRLYPPVPAIGRVLREDVKLASADFVLPKGTTVGVSQYLMHRNPMHYPNPTKFDPDNFLPERCQQRDYYSFIPFSAGPRSCVGRKYAMLKLKILLASIVRNFKITSPVTEDEFQLQGDIILKRADGFRVTLEERMKN